MKRSVLFGLLGIVAALGTSAPALAFEHHQGPGISVSPVAPLAASYPYGGDRGFDRARLESERFERERFERMARLRRAQLERLRVMRWRHGRGAELSLWHRGPGDFRR